MDDSSFSHKFRLLFLNFIPVNKRNNPNPK